MSEASRRTIEITLLGQTYLVNCSDDEEPALLDAARYLNTALEGIHAQGKVADITKIALMAGLNITHELMGERELRLKGEHVAAQSSDALGRAVERVTPRTSPTSSNE
ncbi:MULTISPECIES: cell division protein ZapA [Larsenimonas]|uniref:Cell division protein ZapA n=1 Tax=Larsenimonas suaedae TaxID=1851019 RepID=A0ABU1GSI0_9GAMM|nr:MULTISPECIES: cell division protein ZapA [Larsenimonas]MCM2972661.1 cell division protein ZapA [Larsenimonas suaedae]MCM5704638.1 cell division protein ZapA [Larsenimonas salina]MDR5894542.1 cell division protein ZapA [Larsenimonas suaedae]